MILPTGRVIFLALSGAPAALLLGLVRPDLWVFALVWNGALVAAGVLDALIATGVLDALITRRLSRISAELSHPRQVGVGEVFEARLQVSGTRRTVYGWLPARIALTVALDEKLAKGGRVDSDMQVQQEASSKNWQAVQTLSLTANRRGEASFIALWLRWKGPLGLVWIQRKISLAQTLAVTPNLRLMRENGVRLFTRDSQYGTRKQVLVGEGSEYESLNEFQSGMDRRTIDWNQSARHRKLLAKEYRIERDNRLVLAIDAGRTMAEPVGTMPRVDIAVSAALLLAYVGLKMNDRVSLFHFGVRPQAMTPAYMHSRDFRHLLRAAAAIEYAHEESNFTLALMTLASSLNRRSLILLFTEFADTTQADLLIDAASRLVGKHRLLVIVLKDRGSEEIERKYPTDTADIIRSNVAAALLRDRRLAIAQLERRGVEVLEIKQEDIGQGVLDRYLSIKKRGNL